MVSRESGIIFVSGDRAGTSRSHIGKGVAIVTRAPAPVYPCVYKYSSISDSRNDITQELKLLRNRWTIPSRTTNIASLPENLSSSAFPTHSLAILQDFGGLSAVLTVNSWLPSYVKTTGVSYVLWIGCISVTTGQIRRGSAGQV